MTRAKAILFFAIGVLLGVCIRVGIDQAMIAALEKERDDYRQGGQLLLDEMHRRIGSELMRQSAPQCRPAI